MPEIKVSIIVPVYNTEIYLQRCLKSLISQTLDDIEIVIVNDGSKDNSQNIINTFANLYSNKIKAFKKNNGGLSEARNFGLKYALGSYVLFVDSDDFIERDMCERMYNKAIESYSDVICSPITFIRSKSRTARKSFFPNTKIFGEKIINHPDILHLTSSYVVTKLFKRNFLESNNFTFPVGQYFEDSALVYNILLKANKVEAVNIPFYNYVKDIDGSICNTVDNTIFDIFKSCNSIINFYKKEKVFKNLEIIILAICCKHIQVRVRSLKKSQNRELINNFIDKTHNFLLEASNQAFYNQKFSFRILLISILIKSILKPLCVYLKGIQRLSNTNSKLSLFMFAFRFLYSIFKRLAIKKENRKKYKKYRLSKNQKMKNLKANGIEVLAHLKKIFDEMGLINFADFGTLLGLVREQKLLNHDLDLDYGIINYNLNPDDINVKLERMGFRLWRDYKHLKRTVQLSYYYKGIKVDISIYTKSENVLKTWLFYKAPNFKYHNHERNIVEISHKIIEGTQLFKFNNYLINIPMNPESILMEKYGKKWKTPNKHWIYWKSPCSKVIDEIGYYLEYS